MVINKSRQLLIGSMVVLTLLLVVGATFIFLNNKDDTPEEAKATALYNGEVSIENTPCSVISPDTIYYEAAAIFQTTDNPDEVNNEKAERVAKLEERILNSDNYIQDANCLHILTFINIKRGNAEEAKSYLSLLENGLSEVNPDSYVLDEDEFYLSNNLKQAVETLSEFTNLSESNNPYGDQSRLDEKIDE